MKVYELQRILDADAFGPSDEVEIWAGYRGKRYRITEVYAKDLGFCTIEVEEMDDGHKERVTEIMGKFDSVINKIKGQ